MKAFLSEEDLRSLAIELAIEGKKTGGRNSATFEDLSVLHGYLIAQTLRYLKSNSRFYARQSRLRDSIPERVSLGELRSFPTIDKRTIVRNAGRIISTERKPALAAHTSGTTGRPLEVPVFYSEAEARSNLNTIMTLLNFPDCRNTSVLSLIDYYHGGGGGLPMMVPRAYKAIFFEAFQGEYFEGTGAHIGDELRRIIELLFGQSKLVRTYGRPSILSIDPKEFVRLTRLLVRYGYDPSTSDIRTISTRGNYVSPRVRELAKEKWNATLVDSYSMAEVCGNASQCENGTYHFDLSMVAELLSDDGVTIEESCKTQEYRGYSQNEHKKRGEYLRG